MNLSNLSPPKGQVKRKRRVGQGMGTGRGKYSGRGAKGAKSISGYSRMRGFEGGQMPLHRRLPKRGFHNIFRKEYAIVNLSVLEQLEGSEFTPDTLVQSGVIKQLKNGLKILGEGEISRPIDIKAHRISGSALYKIQAAGGSVQLVPETRVRLNADIINPRPETPQTASSESNPLDVWLEGDLTNERMVVGQPCLLSLDRTNLGPRADDFVLSLSSRTLRFRSIDRNSFEVTAQKPGGHSLTLALRIMPEQRTWQISRVQLEAVPSFDILRTEGKHVKDKA